MNLLHVIATCAPLVHPQTMLHVIQAESSGNTWAVHVNDGPEIHVEGAEAVAAAKKYIEAGKSVDVGLAQINSENFESLGLTVKKAFDPCTNVHAGATILRNNYQRIEGKKLPANQKLDRALSYYNTGTPSGGIKNGYVDRVRHADVTQYEVPSLTQRARKNAPPKNSQPDWDIFGDLNSKGSWVHKTQGS